MNAMKSLLVAALLTVASNLAVAAGSPVGSWRSIDDKSKQERSIIRITEENGELKGVVKNPNYRAISAQFWKSLSAVGDANTVKVLGTPNCGKGEPSQTGHVGHAVPGARFTNVQVGVGNG